MRVRELARITGYTPGHMSRVLSGDRQPSVRCLKLMAKALDVSMEELLRSIGTCLSTTTEEIVITEQ